MNIEQTVSAAVAGLQLGNTFTLDDLRHTVQDRRHRRLRIVELADLDTHDGLCALWFVADAEDIVIHARSDSALHRQQFVLHELAHMILGHCDGDDCTVGEALLPNIPPYTRGRLLSRQDLDSETEIAAESLADRLAAGIRGAMFAESAYSEVFG
ncbi:hypothetical protein [Rarobacter incanus]|uniref:IrrE N-terminal-like domain-containing protein n=1 Tax=Rarobacter incanus TaxID=153494 RepID=A0A542SRY0_9MICO|nr:hypothetical protein [Rarobacter incanus]TQK77352.1 hypothetical protein FB389_2081 [Rarobacter incanus]